MRRSSWILLAGLLGSMAGCGEFVTTGQRATSVDVDVVGDPTDPTPDSMRRADIVGSALPMPDDIDSIDDASMVRGTAPSLPDDVVDSAETESTPDVVGGLGVVKPVSLNSKPATPRSDE